MVTAIHKASGLTVRDDGAVFIPKCKNGKGRHWTYGDEVSNSGYRRVKFNGRHWSVHRLIAEAFIPNPENKSTVDHIDRNKLNNAVKNLRWATSSEQWYNSNQKRTTDSRMKQGKRTDFSEWFHETFGTTTRGNLALYRRMLRLYKKHGCLPVKEM